MTKQKSILSNNDLSLLAIFSFFWKYLKRQKILTILIFSVIPVFFTCDMLLLQKNNINFLPITTGMTFILLSFCGPFYVIAWFLLELKTSVIYKRIGLTGIKSFGFLLITTFYCLTVTLAVQTVGLITMFIIILAKHLSLTLFFNWNTLIFFVISLATGIFLSLLMQFAATLINSNVVQGFTMTFFAVIFLAVIFAINGLLPAIFVSGKTFLTNKELLAVIGVFLGFSALSVISGYLANKFFRWA